MKLKSFDLFYNSAKFKNFKSFNSTKKLKIFLFSLVYQFHVMKASHPPGDQARIITTKRMKRKLH